MENKVKTMNSKLTGSRIPEVKMTKTVRMRLLKANPLIKYEAEKTNDTELMKNLSLDTVSRINNAILAKRVPLVSNTNKRGNEFKLDKVPKQTKFSKPMKVKQNDCTGTTFSNGKVIPSPKQDERIRKLRRSFSASHLNEGLGTINEDHDILNESVSVEDITSFTKERISNFSKTPSNRKHIIFNQSASHRKSVFCKTPSAPSDLKRRLSDWLAKRNRKPSTFKHLKCFGVHKIAVINEENKENVNTSCVEDQGSSYEDLKIENPNNGSHYLEETSLIFAPSDLKRVAKEALTDLQCLVSEGYPTEQCEAWLIIVRNKCPEIAEEPQYWECRASIEQLRGDIGSAVECYKTAVVQGAEISIVEQSLDQLLQKFKLLDIESSTKDQESTNNRAKTVRDFKNVFTSMVIKFAIQEKTLKSKSQIEESRSDLTEGVPTRLLVTPVRRSTRLNRSGYTSTPGVKICSTLEGVDWEVKDKMVFRANEAL